MGIGLSISRLYVDNFNDSRTGRAYARAIMVWRDEQDNVCIEQLSPLFAMVIEQLTQNVKLTDQDIHTLIQSVLTDLSEHDIYLQIQELKAMLTRMRLIQVPHDFKEV